MLTELAALTDASFLAASIPSPPQGVWYLGPVPLRAYGILMATAMIVAIFITQRRYADRGGNRELVFDVAMVAIPCGIVGARLYHVITSPKAYFGPDGSLLEILMIWHGGLAIWGGIAGGCLGGWFMLRARGQRVGPFVDALAPSLLVAQAIGRLGNWFNQELFGGPTTLPWGLQISPEHLPAGYAPGTLFHPTFLYELLWNLAGAALIIVLDRKRRFHGGQLMWLYIMVYTTGRIWIENVRIDTATMVGGLRINVWIMAVTFVVAAIGFYFAGKRGASTRVSPDEQARVASDEQEGKNVE